MYERYDTVQPLFKDHPWEENILVFIHRWSLITGSCMQKMSHSEIKSVFAIDREFLNKGGFLAHVYLYSIRESEKTGYTHSSEL